MNNHLNQIVDSLKRQNRYWLVFTGDSLTSCEWVHPNWLNIVIYVLQNELTKLLDGDWKTAEWGIKGFNFAYDGATTADIVTKINDILLLNPNLVISLMGGNDPVLGISPSQSIDNIKLISQKVAQANSQLVWATSIPAGQGSVKNHQYQPYATLFNQAKLDNVIKIDMFHLFAKFPTNKFFTFVSEENPVEHIKAGQPDLQHPNQLGNAYIAKVFLQELFTIDFNPQVYIQDTLCGQKYPGY